MRKFLAFSRMVIIDAFIYRATGFIWMLNDIGPAVIALIFWSAAFTTHSSVAGYTFSQMLLYYLGIMFVNNVINTQPQFFLSDEIRSGDFSNYLLKPINFTMLKFASNSSWRIVRLIFFIPMLLLVAKLFSLDLGLFYFHVFQWGLIILSLSLAFAINFFFKLALGLTTIWFEESGWLFFGFDILSSFLSGELIPLDLFPNGLLVANNFLPFKYMLYFPLSILLNRLSGHELFFGLLFQFVWCLFAYGLYRLLLRRGSRIYSAYGG